MLNARRTTRSTKKFDDKLEEACITYNMDKAVDVALGRTSMQKTLTSESTLCKPAEQAILVQERCCACQSDMEWVTKFKTTSGGVGTLMDDYINELLTLAKTLQTEIVVNVKFVRATMA